MKKKKKVLAYSRESIIVAVIFLLLAAVLWIQKSGERYTVSTNNNTYLKGNVPTSKAVFESLAKENLVLYDENNATSRRAKEQFAQILKDMKQGYQLVNVAKESLPSFSNYKKVIVLLSDLETVGKKIQEMVDWVEQGGNVLFGVTLVKDNTSASIEKKLGVVSSNYENSIVNNIYIDKDFMIGGGKSYPIDGGFESAWTVSLSSDTKVHAWTDNKAHTPLVWEKKYGKGKFVVDNF